MRRLLSVAGSPDADTAAPAATHPATAAGSTSGSVNTPEVNSAPNAPTIVTGTVVNGINTARQSCRKSRICLHADL